MTDRARALVAVLIGGLLILGYLLFLSTTRAPTYLPPPAAPQPTQSVWVDTKPQFYPSPAVTTRAPRCILFDPNAGVNRCVMYG